MHFIAVAYADEAYWVTAKASHNLRCNFGHSIFGAPRESGHGVEMDFFAHNRATSPERCAPAQIGAQKRVTETIGLIHQCRMSNVGMQHGRRNRGDRPLHATLVERSRQHGFLSVGIQVLIGPEPTATGLVGRWTSLWLPE